MFVKCLSKFREYELQNEMIISEVYALFLLFNSSYVVDLVEVIEDSYNIYLITEYLEKGDLFEYTLKNGPMEEKYAMVIFKEMIYAIHDVHKKGIVHRDIKLENFLLTDNLKVKLCDFGHSGFINKNSFILTSDTVVKGEKIYFKRKCGTLPYSSPSIIKEKLYDGEKEEVWSLGICLYALLTCHFPFYDSKDDERTKELILKSPIPKIPQNVSEDTLQLIKSMLQRNHYKRANLNDIVVVLSNLTKNPED